MQLALCDSARSGGNVEIPGLGGEPVVPRNANTLAFTLDSKENDYCAEFDLSRLVSEQISLAGRLTVVPSPARADIHLTVTCRGFTRVASEFDNSGNPVRYRMTVTVRARLVNVRKGSVIFDDDLVQAYVIYSEVLQPVTSEYNAKTSLARMLAERLERKTTTGWYTELMNSIERGAEK
jgi:hypothetical protein